MHALIQFWSTSSTGLKLGVGAVLLLLFIITFRATQGWVSHYKDKQADKAIAAEREKSEEHRKRADAAEARAKELEGDLKVQDMVIKAAGAKAEAVAAKVKDEDAKFQQELESIGADVDPCERVKRVCTRLHIAPKDCSCTSN